MDRRLYVSTMNVIHFSHEKYAYESLLYALMDSEPEYNMAFGIAGLSVLVDSLSAIKYAKVRPIFSDEKEKKGIITSFDIKGDFPKYGNDSDEADEIAKWVVQTFIEKLRKTPAFKTPSTRFQFLPSRRTSCTDRTPGQRQMVEDWVKHLLRAQIPCTVATIPVR